jgi:hypothetical protein
MANPSNEKGLMADKASNPILSDQQTNVADYTITWTANEPTAGSTATIADGAAPTVVETGQAIADLTAKVNAMLAVLEAHGLMADA